MKRCDCLAAACFEPLRRTRAASRTRTRVRVVQTRGPQTRVDLLRFAYQTDCTPHSGHVGWLKTVFINTIARSWCGAIHLSKSILSSLRSRELLRHPWPLSRRAPSEVCSPRLQRASKHLRAPSSLGASAETSCRRRRRARRPTPAGSRYWGRSTPPLCPSKVCHLRPRRAASAPGGK